MQNYYEGTIWRPPSEASSLIVQASIGCSHNQCAFCISYKGKKYRIRSLKEFEEHINTLKAAFPLPVQRVFLADGNALSIPTKTLLSMLSVLKKRFPHLDRIGIYSYARDCLEKSVDELRSLYNAGIKIAYIGIESGDDEILKQMSKGVTNAENIEACQKLHQAGITVSAILILGLGGAEASKRHARATANSINQFQPEYLGALTLMLPEGTRLHREYLQGDFIPLDPIETLIELRELINGLDQLQGTIFRTNHASNYLPIRGTLSKDKLRLVKLIDDVLGQPQILQSLKPEALRGL